MSNIISTNSIEKDWESDLYELSINSIKNDTGANKFFINFNELKKSNNQFDYEKLLSVIKKVNLYLNENKILNNTFNYTYSTFKDVIINYASENLTSDISLENILRIKKIIKELWKSDILGSKFYKTIFLQELATISKTHVISHLMDKLSIKDQPLLHTIVLNEMTHSPDALASNFKSLEIENYRLKKIIALDYANLKNENVSKYLDLFGINDQQARLELFLNEIKEKWEISLEEAKQLLSEFNLSIEEKLSDTDMIRILKNASFHYLPKFFGLFKDSIKDQRTIEKIFRNCFLLSPALTLEYFENFGLNPEIFNHKKLIKALLLKYNTNLTNDRTPEHIKQKVEEVVNSVDSSIFEKLFHTILSLNGTLEQFINIKEIHKAIKNNSELSDHLFHCKEEINSFKMKLETNKKNDIKTFSDASSIFNVINEIYIFLKNIKKTKKKLLNSNKTLKKEIKNIIHDIEKEIINLWEYFKDNSLSIQSINKLSLQEYAFKIKAWKIVSYLIENPINFDFSQGNYDEDLESFQYGSVFNAVENKKIQFLDLLLKKGAKLLPPNADHYTPLHLAAFAPNNEKMISFLFEKQLSDDSISKIGFTPSYIADALETDFPEKFRGNSYLKKEIYDRKLLANCWGMNRESVIKTPTFEKNFFLKGNLPTIGSKEIARLFDQFIQESRCDFDQSILLKIQEILHNDVRTYTPAKKVLNAFYDGETINLPTGWELKFIVPHGHIIQLMVVENYLLICNRGSEKRDESILIWEIDRNRANLSLEHIEKLKKGRWSQQTAVNFIYNELPRLAGAIADQTNVEFNFKKIIQKSQKMGNCWWLSPKTGVFGLLISLMTLQHLQTRKDQTVENDKSKESIYSEAQKTYKQFSDFCKIVLLKEYLLKHIEEKKRENSEAIAPDFELINVVLEKYKNKIFGKYPSESNEIAKLVEEFKFLYPEFNLS